MKRTNPKPPIPPLRIQRIHRTSRRLRALAPTAYRALLLRRNNRMFARVACGMGAPR